MEGPVPVNSLWLVMSCFRAIVTTIYITFQKKKCKGYTCTDTNKMRKVFNSPLIKNPNKFEGAYRKEKKKKVGKYERIEV
jgi:hypothetical protein